MASLHHTKRASVPDVVPSLNVLLALLALLAVSAAVVSGGVTLLSSLERSPCRGSGRVGSCSLVCMWSSRICRVCCAAITTEESDDGHSRTSEATSTVTTRPGEGESVTKAEGDGDDQPPLVFPNKLPEGTQDAMLETAAHILAIVSREDSDNIRIWVENPERNQDNLDRLASKLSSFPRAPFGRAYWRAVLRASKDRPFTLLRETLAVRAAYLQSVGGLPAPTETDSDRVAAETWWWKQDVDYDG